jgi:hypothetical protein
MNNNYVLIFFVEVVEARTSEQSALKNPIIKLRLGDEKYKAEFLDHGETIVFGSKFKLYIFLFTF